jgi:hypothetical protein
MDRRAFISTMALVPLGASVLRNRWPSTGFPEPVADCWGELPWDDQLFDHPVVEHRRWRSQARMALSMGRHPETWMPLDPDERGPVSSELERDLRRLFGLSD